MGGAVGIDYMSKKYEFLLEDDNIRLHRRLDLDEEMYQYHDTATKIPHFNSSPFEKYKLLRKVGERKFSKVYKGVLLKNENIEVAIKEINAKEIPKNVLNEMKFQINILKQLSHASILRLVAVYEPNGVNANYFVTMEYLKGGEILNAIIRQKRYTDDDILFYSSQMVAGIHYLHSKGIIHGQLLPENIILSHPNFHDRSQNHVKIVGFEHADWAAPSSSRRSAGKKLVVDEFLCPEIIKKWEELEPSSPTTITTSSQIRLTKESDLWSFGKILQLLLLGSLQPYPSPSPSSNYHIQHQTLSPKWTTILTELLQPSPTRRATATDLLDLFSSGRPNNPSSSVAGTGVADARAIIDLSRNIPSLAEFVQNHRKSYPLIVSSGIVHFHRGNRYEEEKVFASFQKPIARR